MDQLVDIEIRDYLIELINSGTIEEDDKLPSENKLSRQFDTSRHTVRKVYDSLEEMGLVITKQGIGRFTHRDLPVVNLSLSEESFTKKMGKQGIPLRTENISCKEIGKDSSIQKEFPMEDNIYEISRLRILYGEPAAIHNSYLSESMFPGIAEEGKSISSIHKYYRDKDIRELTRTNAIITVDFPTNEMMNILNCRSLVPLLVLESKLYDRHGRLVEFIRTYYRSDLFKYELTR